MLGIDAGDVLALSLLTDRGDANTDRGPAKDVEPSASARLSALEITSKTAGVDEALPLLQVTSTGDEKTATQTASALPDNLLIGGTLLPAALKAVVGPDGAVSTVGAGIADLDILSGVLGLTSTQLALGNQAHTDSATGARTLALDGLSVLDLGALLDGLGIPLEELSLDTILGLINGLGLLSEVGAQLDALGLPVDFDLTKLSVESIAGLIDSLHALPAVVDGLGGSSVADACDQAPPGLDVLFAGIIDCNVSLGDAVNDTTVELIQTALDGLLQEVLDTLLDALDDQALVSIEGLHVGIVTKATDSVATSVSEVTAKLGGLTVGALDLGIGDIDLLATAGQVTGAVKTVQDTLNGVLGGIDPALVDLVKITLMEKASSVTQKDGKVIADASFTGLGIDLAKVDLAALLGVLEGPSVVDEILGNLTVNAFAKVLGSDVAAGGDQIGQVLALSDGLSVQVASLAQQSSFAPLASTATPVIAAPAPVPATPALPQTGSNDAGWLLVAAVAAVGALGIRRFVRSGA